ncbi:MAG: MFS transporter [Clostridia bacterium]|nr:MFS transporter [Clostridia bacterium]
MKLNVRRTALVGLGFMAISAFWGVYDFTVPLILKNTYGLGDALAGVIMALDNIVALFLLPFFGSLSDRCTCRIGRRMPFILGGAGVAAVLTLLMPAVVKHAPLTAFLVLLGLLLITMGTFRSPTVALMPDVTPKPLRSKANAIINLMGALGGAIPLVLMNFAVIRTTDAAGNVVSDYTILFVTIAALMVICAVTVFMTIPERRLASEAEAQSRLMDSGREESRSGDKQLSASEKKSLILILCSVSLWFMGYNAVTTAFSKYAMATWNVAEASAANCMLVGTVGAIVSYWPVGLISSRIGRKKMILTGVSILMLCFLTGTIMKEMNFVAFIMFALVGLGWASINVNSFPMVVELAAGSDVGRYTGFYYTFSMAAQVLTPILSGYLLEHVGYWTLFPYALLMVTCALITMSQVKHGDNKPVARKGLEALDVED